MTADAFVSGGAFKRWAVVSALLLLQVACTTAPTAPAQVDSLPATAAVEKAKALPKAAATPPEASKSRLADFISRRILRQNAPAAVVDETAEAPADLPIDEKYRLTGEAALELERGKASWYGTQFHGRATASGETYDKYALTAAHKTLPFGTIVRVRSVKLGREVDVRINDRGPFVAGRVIDVSEAAAEALGLVGAGVLEVSLNVAEATAQEVLDSVNAMPSRASKKSRTAKASTARKSGKSSASARQPKVAARR